MADMSSKLNKLVVADGPPRCDLTKLVSEEGYPIMGVRFHQHTKYGTSIIFDLEVDGQRVVAFLPKRFARTLCQAEVDCLSSGGYRIRTNGVTNKSPNIIIFKP